MQTTFNPRTKHSPAYYSAVIKALIVGLEAGLTRPKLRTYFESLGLKTATGSTEWTEAAMAGLFARLKAEAGHFYVQALRMFLAGELSKDQMLLLKGKQ